MIRATLLTLVGILATTLPAGATPVDTYAFETAAATDTGSTLRRLVLPGLVEEPSLAAPGTKSSRRSAPGDARGLDLSPASVSPGVRLDGVLMTQAMSAPWTSSTDAVAPDPDEPRVLISEPPVALLLLIGLIGLIRRR